MAEENAPDQADWYPQLIVSTDGREIDGEEMDQALEVARTAMEGVESMLAENKITNVQVSFELVRPESNLEFNYSAPKEEA